MNHGDLRRSFINLWDGSEVNHKINTMKIEIDYPLVSIGVPVYNGEKGLASALDSLFNQDYPNFEIIISDNGSSDSTQYICEEYAGRDSRVKHSRSEVNRGIVWNFNRVFSLSSGKYFMWAAHDDLRESDFVSECVRKMEQCPDAVLCQAHTAMFIEGREDMLCIHDLESFKAEMGLVERYRETLKFFPATAIYGLYRSSAMRKTHMWQKSIATDLAFIQELSIYGEFVEVPKVLFKYIVRKKWNTVHQDYYNFLGKKKKPWWYLPFVALLFCHCRSVISASIPLRIKTLLLWVLIKHEIGEIIMKIQKKLIGKLFTKKWKEKLTHTLYNRWMHNPNIRIINDDLFLERVIKPKLGWWTDKSTKYMSKQPKQDNT